LKLCHASVANYGPRPTFLFNSPEYYAFPYSFMMTGSGMFNFETRVHYQTVTWWPCFIFIRLRKVSVPPKRWRFRAWTCREILDQIFTHEFSW